MEVLLEKPRPWRMDEGLLIAAVLDSTTVVAHATSTAGANLRFHFPWRARMMSCNFLQRGSRDFLSNSNFTPCCCFQKVHKLCTLRPGRRWSPTKRMAVLAQRGRPDHFFRKATAIACSFLTKVKVRSKVRKAHESFGTTKWW